jgi:hypothetical protein
LGGGTWVRGIRAAWRGRAHVGAGCAVVGVSVPRLVGVARLARACPGWCGCAQVGVGVPRLVWVCSGWCGCAQVGVGVPELVAVVLWLV